MKLQTTVLLLKRGSWSRGQLSQRPVALAAPESIIYAAGATTLCGMYRCVEVKFGAAGLSQNGLTCPDLALSMFAWCGPGGLSLYDDVDACIGGPNQS